MKRGSGTPIGNMYRLNPETGKLELDPKAKILRMPVNKRVAMAKSKKVRVVRGKCFNRPI